MNPAVEHESIDDTLHALPVHDEERGLLRRKISTAFPAHSSKMEESWNGLFLASISDFDATASSPCSVAKTVESNKKMGHTSFTDLGVYARNQRRYHSSMPHDKLTSEEQRLTPQDIQTAKSQFMKLRVQRMLKASQQPLHKQQQQQGAIDRMHSSDSALLRKSSSMDTQDLQGLWYRAKHPRHCDALEQLAQSAPAGSLDLEDSFSS